jgi:hypothetical protein
MWAVRLRCFALLGAAALGLHELRYVIAYGGGADRALAGQGHAYLDAAGAVVALALVSALAVLVASVVRGRRGVARFTVRWPVASAGLLAIYIVQELAEGMVASGHPAGVEGVFGHGGLVAVPLAVALGAAVAVLLRGADAVLERFAPMRRAPRRRAPRVELPRAPLAVRPRRTAALAGLGAGRAPPFLGHRP